MKDPGQRIVIGGGDGIEFMIVAAGARNCLREESAANAIDLMINNVGIQLLLDIVLQRPGADRQIPGRDELLASLFVSVVRQQVAGDLLNDESIEWFVVVEG